jgi:hypothetical protein
LPDKNRFEKYGFIVQTILASVGLLTLIGFITFSVLQHNDSVNSLSLEKQNSDFNNSATKKSLALADSSNNMTRQSIKIAQDALVYQRWRDSINTFNQNVKDSSFADSQLKRDSLNLKFFIIGNRAYLDIVGIDSIVLKVNQPIYYRIVITNSGKTPTYNIHGLFLAKTGIGVYPAEFDSLDIGVAHAIIWTTLGAGQIRLSETPPWDNWPVFRNKDSILVFNKKVRFFIFGKLVYNDKLGGTYYTRFAYEFDPDRSNSTEYSFSAYRNFNEGN